MWRLTVLLRHNRHDKAGMSHNFASDTLSKVYRDAVYAPQPRYRGNPMFPEWSATSAADDVTNHVGNLGVMSARAAELRRRAAAEEMEPEGDAQHQPTQTEGKRGATTSSHVDNASSDPSGTGHAQHHNHGPAKKPAVSPFQNMSAAPTAAATSVTARATPSAIERLRGSKQRSEAHGSAATHVVTSARTSRHSGVQMEILSLYRQSLRETRRMRDPDTQGNLRRYIRDEYTKNMDIPRKHITKIEWHINHAKRKLEDLQAMNPSTRFSIHR